MKLKSKISTAFFVAFLLTITSQVYAQTGFLFSAKLKAIDSTGFCQINLQPGLVAKCKTDLSDIRLTDQSGKAVPYILNSSSSAKESVSFIPFPGISGTSKSDSTTVFIAENKGHFTTNQLWLKLRNAAVLRTASLSGSDDQNKWYAIKEDIELQQAGETENGTYEQLLTFPSSTYRYFKVTVNNKHNAPVAILQVGVYQSQSAKPEYIAVPDLRFTQRDSANLSHIVISFSDAELMDKIHLDIEGSKFYKRNVKVYALLGKQRVFLTDTEISSAHDASDLYLLGKTKLIELEIYNGDNPPLVIKAVKAYQLQRSVTAYLEKGKQYQLQFGNKNIAAPDYDLKFFSDSVHQQLPQLGHLAIIANAKLNATVPSKLEVSAWLIWLGIALALAVLAILTLRMTQEVKKRSADGA